MLATTATTAGHRLGGILVIPNGIGLFLEACCRIMHFQFSLIFIVPNIGRSSSLFSRFICIKYYEIRILVFEFLVVIFRRDKCMG